MAKPKISGETREAKFKRIATARANKILSQIRILRNCTNTQIYTYTPEQVRKIFNAIEDELKITKDVFHHNKRKTKRIEL